MIIYHGSEKIIKKPVFGKGNVHNDYGRGFYCTQSLQLAKEWACNDKRGGFSNMYELQDEGLKILNLADFSILHWVTVLINNRIFDIKSEVALSGKDYLNKHFFLDTSGVDMIKGYRADDSYFSFAQDFLDNIITVKKLAKALHLGSLGEQIVLKSKESFDRVQFLSAEEAKKEIFYPMRKHRDDQARREYFDSRGFGINKDDLFLADIIREEIKADDPRIQ